MSKILDLIVRVSDQASEQLKQIQGTPGEAGTGVRGTADAFLGMAAKVGVAYLGTKKAVDFVNDSLDDWQEYVFTIDNLAKAFGMTYEETEQLVYIADVYNISNDALFSTLNKLARDGFGTGTEALNGLRQEFQAIADPAEAAGLLFATAGEQGQKVLGPLMEMTDLEWGELMEGIEALENIDQEMVDNARELEAATAEISQEWNELKIQLANWSAPGLTAFLNQISALLGGEATWNQGQRGQGGMSAGDWEQTTYTGGGQGGLNFNEQLEDTLRNLPDNISDAIERSSGGWH